MSISPSLIASCAATEVAPAPPAWAFRWACGDALTFTGGPMPVTLRRGDAALATARIAGAVELTAEELHAAVIAAHRALRLALDEPMVHPVRFWNFLPRITAPLGPRHNRYMIFNGGRHAALCEWFGGADELAARLPAASAVGHRGDDLHIHCLAMDKGGNPIQNARQIPAIHYSQRYGPLPPCFARATAIDHPREGRLRIIAGTASIRGESTVHIDDVVQQLRETFANLAAVGGGPAGAALSNFREVRAYAPRESDIPLIRQEMEAMFGAQAVIELVRADLCRRELLVEIEALAVEPARESPTDRG